MKLSHEEITNISRSINDEEIYHAANGLGEKGVAWDYLAHWVPKLLTRITPEELVQLYRNNKRRNGNYDQDCIDV